MTPEQIRELSVLFFKFNNAIFKFAFDNDFNGDVDFSEKLLGSFAMLIGETYPSNYDIALKTIEKVLNIRKGKVEVEE